MILHIILLRVLLHFLFMCSCAALCRTTNDHKNYTCTGFGLGKSSLSNSTKLALLRVRLYDCSETDIKERILDYPKIETLTISCGTINQIDKNAVIYKNHQILRAEFTNCPEIEIIENVVTFPKLEYLTISCGTIRNVHNNAFKSSVHIKELSLGNNQISSLGSEVFLPIKELIFLNLSNNNFENLLKDTFRNTPTLKSLILSNNQIQDFELNVFQNNQQLEELYLNNNQIDFVPSTLLNPLKKLASLDLSQNKIEILTVAFTNNHVLEYLNLSYNMIKELEPRIFATNNLKSLDLSFNGLLIIHEDSLPLQTLEDLYLQNNQIYSFDVTVNKIVDYPLRLLDLRNNRLVTLAETFIKKSNNLNVLKVDNNPWDCKCFQKIVIWRGEKEIELGIDYRTGEEPLCVYKNHVDDCNINITDVHNYYNILERYWQLR